MGWIGCWRGVRPTGSSCVGRRGTAREASVRLDPRQLRIDDSAERVGVAGTLEGDAVYEEGRCTRHARGASGVEILLDELGVTSRGDAGPECLAVEFEFTPDQREGIGLELAASRVDGVYEPPRQPSRVKCVPRARKAQYLPARRT